MTVWALLVGGWLLFEVGAAVAQHGRPKEGVHNGWASTFVYGLLIWLLYMGGFFKGLA